VEKAQICARRQLCQLSIINQLVRFAFRIHVSSRLTPSTSARAVGINRVYLTSRLSVLARVFCASIIILQALSWFLKAFEANRLAGVLPIELAQMDTS